MVEDMSFRDFLEMDESFISGALKRGLLAGAIAAAPFHAGPSGEIANHRRVIPMKAPDFKSPKYKKMERTMKDEGRYYDSFAEKELRRRAEMGDEWAVRELPWPKDHRFHKFGRPFFRNDGPHPDGLFGSPDR
jgi:hypothetical protein